MFSSDDLIRKTVSAAKEPMAELVAKMVPAPIEKTCCATCQEAFEEVWSDTEEEWMYRNAMLHNNQVLSKFNLY